MITHNFPRVRKCDYIVYSTGTGVDAQVCGRDSMCYCETCEAELCESHKVWCEPCELHFCLAHFDEHSCPLAELAEQVLRHLDIDQFARVVGTLAAAALHDDEPSFIEKQIARRQ